MSFTKKLLAGFAAMLLLVLVLSATALVVIKDLGENVTQISKVSARQQALAGEISTSAAMMGSVEGSLLIAAILGDRSKVDVAQQEFQDSAAHLRRALQQFQSGGEASTPFPRAQPGPAGNTSDPTAADRGCARPPPRVDP